MSEWRSEQMGGKEDVKGEEEGGRHEGMGARKCSEGGKVERDIGGDWRVGCEKGRNRLK